MSLVLTTMCLVLLCLYLAAFIRFLIRLIKHRRKGFENIEQPKISINVSSGDTEQYAVNEFKDSHYQNHSDQVQTSSRIQKEKERR